MDSLVPQYVCWDSGGSTSLIFSEGGGVTSGGGGGGTGGTGSTGSTGSTGTVSSPGEIVPLEQCKIDALKFKNSCITAVETTAFISASLCLGFAATPATLACEGATYVAMIDAKGDCEVGHAVAVAICE